MLRWRPVADRQLGNLQSRVRQNSDATPAIRLMNGATPVAEKALPDPGAGWQLISVDHFTPNGQPDLLFQTTNGAMGLWRMNGTNIVADGSR
jgi:hypothetical protein